MRGADIGSRLGIGICFDTVCAISRYGNSRCERTPPQRISARAVLESTRSTQTVGHKPPGVGSMVSVAVILILGRPQAEA